MKSPRPKRLRKERVPWEAIVIPTLGTAKKAERKAPRISKTDALKPIPLKLLLARFLRDVYSDQLFHFFLDNLFLTVPVT
jgi:hypothetical protein